MVKTRKDNGKKDEQAVKITPKWKKLKINGKLSNHVPVLENDTL